MVLFLNLIYFAVFVFYAVKLLTRKDYVEMSVPFQPSHMRMQCTGLEALLILFFATGLTGFIPILALHLAVVEVMCIIAIRKAPYPVVFSGPMKIFTAFLLWAVIGILYTPNPEYGIRMLLKYIYPLLIALFASSVVRDKEVFLKASQWGRWVAVVSVIVVSLPSQGFFFKEVFWGRAGLATNYIVWTIFSLALFEAGVQRQKNLFFTILFILPCIFWVFRTDIFGTAIALSSFYFVKYRLKSAPLIAGFAALAVCALFYIPSIKEKMYFRPDEVTIEDFIEGNVDEDNINTSGRKPVWEDVERWYYKGHEIYGSGTGRVQTYFYTEAIGWRHGGQLHNDLLVIKCDNGLIGLGLFLLTYLAVLLHCVYMYNRSQLQSVRLCTVVAGASLMGIFVTTYSDNSISYSLATLGYPWAFYGMALGMRSKERT